jgi:hypothetical protein
MLYDLTVGSISWIHADSHPVSFAFQALTQTPHWIPKTYMGLAATANPTPPNEIADFKSFQAQKQFRALLYCHFTVELDPTTNAVGSFNVLDAVHDPGWTPPFDKSKFSSTKLMNNSSMSDPNFYPGEASSISLVNTRARHANTVLPPTPKNEVVCVNALIKFRAGSHTDSIGVSDDVGSPFHVPWVWCELLLTYDRGIFKLLGCGSIFPTHYFYIEGKKVLAQEEVADLSFPKKGALTINESALNLYPVLSKGALASGPQTSLAAETGLSGPVRRHLYTADGRLDSSGNIIPLVHVFRL